MLLIQGRCAFVNVRFAGTAGRRQTPTAPEAEKLVSGYLHGQDAGDPQASPLFAAVGNHPPTRIHVGDDELLHDNSIAPYGRKAAEAGADVTVDLWQGMAHGFGSGVGRLAAAGAALDAFCPFLAAQTAR